MNIGEKIKQLRTRKLMTQSELAGDSVSRNMLSLIENGRATPSIQTLEALAAKLKVTPAFLIAEEDEQAVLLKQAQMADIRIAFSGKNFRISTDLCRKLYADGLTRDDEVDLIMAESLFENAKEALLLDHVRVACHLFDESVFYAMRTIYYTEHLIAAAGLYFEYLGMLSPSLMSENLDAEAAPLAVGVVPNGDIFCRYIRAILDGDCTEGLTLLPSDPAYAHLLAAHIRAKRNMRAGDFEMAVGDLTDILHGEDILPGILLYHVFGDMEECCQRLGNQKNARLYQDLKVSQFEKLLS